MESLAVLRLTGLCYLHFRYDVISYSLPAPSAHRRSVLPVPYHARSGSQSPIKICFHFTRSYCQKSKARTDTTACQRSPGA